jgi:predicted DCC family thiol-disulfide oxidoreductase YuxK
VTTTLVYDGDCAFCTTCVGWVARLGLAVDAVTAWQHADLAALGLTPAQCEAAVQLVEEGRVTSGHEAVGRLLLRGPWWWRPIGVLLLVPPTSWLACAVYRWVAGHRSRLPGGTPACALPPGERPGTS